MKTFWRLMNDLIGVLDTIAIIILVAALMLSVGYHLGFTKGVEVKVSIVGEKYILKERGARR